MSFARLRAQIIKEFLSLLRDPKARAILIVPPMLQLFILSFAATLDVKNATVGIYNQDSGQSAYELVQAIEHASFVGNLVAVHSEQGQQQLIDQHKALLVVHIPEDYSHHRLAGTAATVQVLMDGRRANAAQVALNYLQQIALSQGGVTEPVRLRHNFNPNLIYRWFIVPGLSGILAMFVSLVITSLSIARERELGTFDQLLVSPTRPLEIIIAKCIPAVVVGFALGSLMILAALLVFQVPLSGSLLTMAASLLLFIVSVVGIGLMISALAMTQQQAILGAFAVGIPMILMSGFATPIENMPALLRAVAEAIPLTHYLVLIHGIFLKAAPAAVISQHLWPMALITLVTLSGATIMVRWRLQ
ncbi:ABC transporter permease [Gallaecimonas sp. GXIMD1310]|uniref:ABC transporter permease n=1 Tax=Gallaecimonas sp. GXIMD1310 TaxID=3131926 RepID=UPI00324F859E